jgi:ATP-dependent Clp protease ATP-binding subunit ClpB
VNFKNTVIIMTSNIGGHAISESSGDLESAMPQLMEALRSTFRPEFLNRIDDVIVFHRLTKDLIKGIVELQIKQLGKILEQKNLVLKVSSEAVEALAREGYDPVYGARPLKRLIQKKILDRLALMLLSSEILPGDTIHLGADRKTGELVFEKPAAAGD